MESVFAFLERIDAFMIGAPALLALSSVGVLFTVWSRFGLWRTLSHEVRLAGGARTR